MAGQFVGLFEVPFSAVSTITVTHNLDRAQVGVIVRIGNVARNDLIDTITPVAGNARNEIVVVLDSSQSGEIIIVDTDYIFAAIPSPENAASIAAGFVSSVFARTGAVVAVLNDYAASLIDNDSTVSGSTVKDALNTLLGAIPSVPVSSVFTRTGAVIAALNDYAASLVDNDSTVSGATVKDALETLGAASGSSPLLVMPFGGKSDDTGKFLLANSRSTNNDDSSKPRTRAPIPVTGTITKLVYQTSEADSGTQMRIHVDGSIQATVTLASINANFGGVETVSISVTAGEYAEIEYQANQKPGECIMYLIVEAS